MIVFIAGTAGVLVVIGVVALMRSEDRRDDRALRRRNPFPAPDHPGFTDLGPMPPEIAHERNPFLPRTPGALTWDDAIHHQYPVTSPAWPDAPPQDANPSGGAEPRPGTAAAAGIPPPAPPPLPEGALWAPADTGFADWESDTFVGGLTPIRDHGDCDWPVPAPREWHAEMERGT